MKIAVFGKSFEKSFEKSIFEIFQKFKEYDAEVMVYEPFYKFMSASAYFEPKVDSFFNNSKEITSDIDFFFSIGGDGTFLEAICYVRNNGIPLVGFNSGRLGFLADISQDKISNAIDEIFIQEYSIEERVLIDLVGPPNLFGDFHYALNECTIHKKDSSSMITIHTYIDNKYLNSYWADGLIISTPTGSTAYSLSAGGPIVVPNSNNFIITPLAPHNLTVRPIVIPDSKTLTLKVEGRSENYLLSLDSRFATFDSSAEIKLQKGEFPIKVLKLKSHNFFNTLRHKLMWGVDKRN